MAVDVRRLPGPFGAELVGFDLESPTADDEVVARRAFLDHQLVLVRTGGLSAGAQRSFASWFGAISTQGYAGGSDTEPVKFISNTRPEGVARAGSLLQHSDFCFFDTLLRGLCLYAEEVPEHGGETIFANAQLAAARLPPTIRTRLQGLHACHVYDYRNDYGTTRFRVADAPDAPHAVHPVLLPHPATGTPVLYVNELMTDAIVELDPDQSEALLGELFSALRHSAVRYQHRWTRGDVIVWDNIALQHGRTDFPPSERRSLRRLQIA